MQIQESLKHLLTVDLVDQSRLKARSQLLLRAVYAVVRDLANGDLTLRSMSLSFSTLLSMVPMLAFSFSVLKGFGAHNYLEPILMDFLEPMGESGQEVGTSILGFVENMNLAVLGSAGLLVLIFTVVSLVKKVEDSFNYIWNVRVGRSLFERLRDYLSVLLLGPMMAVSGAGIATTLQQSDLALSVQEMGAIGAMLVGLLYFIPKLIVFVIFIFLYAFLPNTRVTWLAAAMGALVASILWLIASWGFTSFAASSTKYTAIYSSFAVLILFLIWLNLVWLFVLMGANIAYYVQNPDQLLLTRGKLRPSAATRERVAMQTMLSVARDHDVGRNEWNADKLQSKLNMPRGVIDQVLQDLLAAGLLVETRADQNPCYLPGKASDHIQLTDIVEAVHLAGQSYGNNHDWDQPVEQLFAQLVIASRDALGASTLADLVRAAPDGSLGGGSGAEGLELG